MLLNKSNFRPPYFPIRLHDCYPNILSVKNFNTITESTGETKYLGVTFNSKTTSKHKFPASAYSKLHIEGTYSFFHGKTARSGPEPPHCRGFVVTPRHNTFGRAPLDEWSARRIELYLIIYTQTQGQTSMLPVNSNPQKQQANGHRPTP